VSRLLAAVALGAIALAPVTARAADPVPQFGGRCDGVVDFDCRDFECGPDDLDCGLIPPCFVWVFATGCVL
jgi:hypothetical protein